MTQTTSANQRKALGAALGVMKPVIIGTGAVRYGNVLESLCICCGCMSGRYGEPTGKVGGFKTAFTNAEQVPVARFPESILIPDGQLNYLIEWEDL